MKHPILLILLILNFITIGCKEESNTENGQVQPGQSQGFGNLGHQLWWQIITAKQDQAVAITGTPRDGTVLQIYLLNPSTGAIESTIDRDEGTDGKYAPLTPSQLALDDSNVYIAGGSSGSSESVVEAYNRQTKELIWSESTYLGSCKSRPSKLAVDGNAIYIAGSSPGSCNDGTGHYEKKWLVQKRDSITGNLLWEQTTDHGSGLGWASQIEFGADYVIFGGAGSYSSTSFKVQARDKESGNLLWEKDLSNNNWGKIIHSSPYLYALTRKDYQSKTGVLTKLSSAGGNIEWTKEISIGEISNYSSLLLINDRIFVTFPSSNKLVEFNTSGDVINEATVPEIRSEIKYAVSGSVLYILGNLYGNEGDSQTLHKLEQK